MTLLANALKFQVLMSKNRPIFFWLKKVRSFYMAKVFLIFFQQKISVHLVVKS